MGKLVFFDIDGTLWDWKNFIPESTKEAISAIRKNGHKTFINSGRTRSFIQNPELFELGFDGVVSGCGTMIEYEGQIVFKRDIEKTFLGKTIEILRECGIRPILEGRNYIYVDPEDFPGDIYVQKMEAEIGERLLTIKDHHNAWEASKLSCFTSGADMERFTRELGSFYDVIYHREISVIEMLPKGFGKGTGIQRVCQILNASMEDTIAIGDGPNDIDMLRAASVGVVMGDGAEEAKKEADLITTGLHEDGIRNACELLGLM